jgi:hypothetical protein
MNTTKNQRRRNAELLGIQPERRPLKSMERLSSEVKKSTTSEATALETLEKSVQELSRRLQIVENSLSEANLYPYKLYI